MLDENGVSVREYNIKISINYISLVHIKYSILLTVELKRRRRLDLFLAGFRHTIHSKHQRMRYLFLKHTTMSKHIDMFLHWQGKMRHAILYSEWKIYQGIIQFSIIILCF